MRRWMVRSIPRQLAFPAEADSVGAKLSPLENIHY
jgi:hypothetical protein